ncbi:hypothetical protein Efla_000848 [Eimeria flavescens]
MGEEITAEELRWERSRPPFCRLDARLREAGSHKEEPLNNVLSRHVKQAADFNKALEKRQLWREREKELRAKHSDTWGILQAEGERRKRGEEAVVSSSAKRALDSLEAEGVDKEVVERVKKQVARKFGSVDVHAAIRQRIASQKEKRQLQLQNEQSDAWMPDRFYTEELKQKTPWLNPIEFLNELHQQQREESLTPVASESDGDSTKRKKKSKHKKGKKKKKKEKKENKQKKCKKADRG